MWWSLTLATFSTFWIEDLHTARFAFVLFAIPAAALFGRVVGLGASVGGMAGVALVWMLMMERADNGCTGVSASFSRTNLVLGVLLFVGAPWAVWSGRSERQLPIAGLRR